MSIIGPVAFNCSFNCSCHLLRTEGVLYNKDDEDELVWFAFCALNRWPENDSTMRETVLTTWSKMKSTSVPATN